MNKTKVNAKMITNSLIDFLNKKYKDKTIATEISINTSFGVKVADVILANRYSFAFEIKSELDTIKRLDTQVKGYSEIFDYVYLVYWRDKFKSMPMYLPDNIGVIVAFWNDKKSKIQFALIKKAKLNTIENINRITYLLWKDELIYLLNKKNIRIKTSYSKDVLVELLLKNHSHIEIIKAFRFILRNRYKNDYSKYQETNKTVEDLEILKKYKIDLNYINYLGNKENDE